MDTLSFVLGIATVVVIASAVVSVIAIVKAYNQNKKLRSLYARIDSETPEIYREIDKIEAEINRRITEVESQLYSQIDSRLDKLENKLTYSIKK